MEREETAARTKLWAMIKSHRFAMMATRHEGDALRSRPMTTISDDHDEVLWFFARRDSEVADDIRRHPQVCLSYADAEARDFVSVAGAAALVTDAARKHKFWNPMVHAWFPEGADSPEVVLIAVTPEHAEFWDSKRNKLVQLFSVTRALASGTQPRDIGEHREVAMPANPSRQ